MRKVNSLSPFKLGPQTSYRVLLPAEPSHQNLKVGIITLANYYFEKKHYIHVNQERRRVTSISNTLIPMHCITYFKIYFLHVIAGTFSFAKCCI